MIKLFDSLSQTVREFVPQDPNHITMYVCGPTVYDFAHIGNARPVVVFDVLYRMLQRTYPKVTYVRNITDVDDKINKAAEDSGRSIYEITEGTIDAYHEDMGQLLALSPTLEPRATQHIESMITFIQGLISKGHAYEAEGHVLFKVGSQETYGCLSKRNREDMIAGARVEIAPYKQDPADFVLWKPSNERTPGWESPWGRGRPGWHIECSAMAKDHLGETFDIHGGGRDLMFPHHENEIAQSTALHGDGTFAQYWVHNGMLLVNGSKMSKSLGNFITVRDLFESIPGEVIRLVLLSAHYSQTLDWTPSAVDQAKATLDRLYGALEGAEDTGIPDSLVETALQDNLNTPLAIARLHELAGSVYKAEDPKTRQMLATTLKASGALLGLLPQTKDSWFKGTVAVEDLTWIESQIQARCDAKKNKDYRSADAIRKELFDQGIVLEDTLQGTVWKRL